MPNFMTMTVVSACVFTHTLNPNDVDDAHIEVQIDVDERVRLLDEADQRNVTDDGCDEREP